MAYKNKRIIRQNCSLVFFLADRKLAPTGAFVAVMRNYRYKDTTFWDFHSAHITGSQSLNRYYIINVNQGNSRQLTRYTQVRKKTNPCNNQTNNAIKVHMTRYIGYEALQIYIRTATIALHIAFQICCNNCTTQCVTHYSTSEAQTKEKTTCRSAPTS